MRTRIFTACFLSFLLIFQTLSLGTYATDTFEELAEEAEIVLTEDGTLYVDAANGNDTTGTGAMAAPYATLDAAIKALDAIGGGDIVIVGTYTLSSDLPSHENMITVSGGILNVTASLSLGGAFGFENIELNSKTLNGDKLYTLGGEFVAGDGITTTSAEKIEVMLGVVDADLNTPINVTINSGNFGNIYIGVRNATASRNVAGANVVINGGSGTLMIGTSPQPSDKTLYRTQFTAPANFTINGGEWKFNYYGWGGLPQFNQGFQLSVNNGTELVLTGDGKLIPTHTLYYPDGMKWVTLSSATDGSGIIPTTTSGKFKVVGNKYAVATDPDGVTYVSSADGYLTIPGGNYDVGLGHYTITYRTSPIENDTGVAVAYVDSSKGLDTNTGASSTDAFATIDKAVEVLENLENDYSERKIVIVGTYTLSSDLPSHDNLITITGDTLNFSTSFASGGDIKFENIELNATTEWQRINTNGYNFFTGKGVTSSSSSYAFSVYLGVVDANCDKKLMVEIGSGNFETIVLGTVSNTANRNIAGAEVVMNGGSGTLIFGSAPYSAEAINMRSVFTAPVMTTINGGEWEISYTGWYQMPTFNGGFQLILNNGEVLVGSLPINSNYYPSEKYVMSSSATNGSLLEATDTIGKFKVIGGKTAVATDNSAGEYISSVGYLVVPAGTYEEGSGNYTVIYQNSPLENDTDTAFCYVDAANGNDYNIGVSADKAFKTIETAISSLELLDGYANYEVRIIGEYSMPGEFPLHSKMITLTQGADGATIIANDCSANGPFKIENITYKLNSEWAGALRFDTDTLILGEGVETNATTDGFKPTFELSIANTDRTTSLSLNVKSGVWGSILLGGKNNTIARSIPGATAYLEGGESAVYFGEATNSWSTPGVTERYTENVNVIISGGTHEICFYPSGYNKHPIFEKAFQIILNGGTQHKNNSIPNENAALNYLGGKWIMRSEAVSGSYLDVTSTAGKFTVFGTKIACATGTDGSVHFSKNGVLTVPAGDYMVTYLEKLPLENDTDTAFCYVDTTLSVSGDGLTAQTAFNSLDTAVAALDALTGTYTSREVRVVGTCTVTNSYLPLHEQMISFVGASDDARIAVSGETVINGPTTFANIAMHCDTTYMHQTNGSELIFGENFSYSSEKQNWLIGSTTGDTIREKATINSGDHGAIWIGTHGYKVEGATLILNDGSATSIYIGSIGPWANGALFTDTVTVVFNGGNFPALDRYNPDEGKNRPTFLNIQLIANNGIKLADYWQPCNRWWIIEAEATEGCYIESTATGGTYKVVGGKTARVINTENGRSYFSSGGTLVLPYVSTYTPRYKVYFLDEYTPGVETRYVDAKGGSDSAAGLTAGSAYATMDAAIAELESIVGYADREIVIIGDYTVNGGSLPAHSKDLRIKSDGTGTLTFTEDYVSIGGPTELENIGITSSVGALTLATDGYKTAIGEGVTVNGDVDILAGGKNDTGREKLTVNSGSFNHIYVGNGKTIDGADIILNGGEADGVTLSAGRFTDSVTVTINDGSYAMVDSSAAFDSTVSVVVNSDFNVTNGITHENSIFVTVNDTENYLAHTENYGEFVISGTGYTRAYNLSSDKTYTSFDGKLNIGDGRYEVSFGEALADCDGNTINVYDNINLDFAKISHTESEGKMFIGWFDNSGVAAENDASFEAGTVLTARYIDVDTSYDDGNGADFGVLGAQIRLVDKNNKHQGLRFITEKSSSFARKLSSVTVDEYGTVVLPKAILGAEALEYGRAYGEYESAAVVAEKIYRELGDRIWYTAVMTGITEGKYSRVYAVRPYICYRDANGVSRIFYGETYDASTYEIAKIAIEKDTSLSDEARATLQAIVDSVEE